MVYMLHFTTPLSHAKHYVGFTDNVPQRLNRHRSGHGSPLVKAVQENGSSFVLARLWDGDRKLERRIKDQKNSPRFCPICNAAKARRQKR